MLAIETFSEVLESTSTYFNVLHYLGPEDPEVLSTHYSLPWKKRPFLHPYSETCPLRCFIGWSTEKRGMAWLRSPASEIGPEHQAGRFHLNLHHSKSAPLSLPPRRTSPPHYTRFPDSQTIVESGVPGRATTPRDALIRVCDDWRWQGHRAAARTPDDPMTPAAPEGKISEPL